MAFEEIDNAVWSWNEDGQGWCKNKVYDEITDEENEEIWKDEAPDKGDKIRLNGKCV